MAKQLTINFAREHACSECGEMFPAEALNHWELCKECVLDLETLADFRDAVALRRDGMSPLEKAQEVAFTRKQALKAAFLVSE